MADTTILELCAGVGMLGEGIAAGLRAIGRKPRVLGYVERDAYAAAVLLARMESKALEPAPVWAGNLEAVRWEQFAGFVDVVAAGFPCQPHSHAGSRKGTDDSRWIWPAIAECIRVVRPGIVYLENVAGLRSSGGMAPVLADLAALGFHIEWDSIRASDVGASHQRERVFILAYQPGNGWHKGRPESSGIIGRLNASECCGAMADAEHAEGRRIGEGGGEMQRTLAARTSQEMDNTESIYESRPTNEFRASSELGCSGEQLAHSGRLCSGAHEQEPVTECSRATDDCACCCVVAHPSSARSAPRLSGPDAGNEGLASFALNGCHADELADAGRARLQGIEQQSAHDQDGRTDGRTDGAGTMPTSYPTS